MWRLRWAVLLIGVVAVCLVALTGSQALKARDALKIAASDFDRMAGQLADGDGPGARKSLASAQGAAVKAEANTDGPGWWFSSQLPGIGDDITAVRTVSDVVETLASDVLPSVVDASETLKPSKLRPVDGKVDLDGIVAVAPAVVDANEELHRQAARVDALETDHLSVQLADPIELLQVKLGEAAAMSEKASRAVRLLPPMLGADGKRTYLLLFQNNAEIRTTGGIPGAFATITANHGRVKLVKQGDAADIGQLEKPALPLTREEVELFEEKMGLFPQNVNFTPDFPRTAELARAMVQAGRGGAVDGVISTDPVALSYILGGTGPIVAGGRKLSADNAVHMLLSQTYADYPEPEQQNEFFAAAARSIFDAISAGQGEPRLVLDGIAHAAAEKRLLVWSSHPEEQKVLAPTQLSGTLPSTDDGQPFVGVFFNDGTGAKMDYYLDYQTSVKSMSCTSGRQHLRVTLTMESTAPKDAAATLPAYVTGGEFGSERGNIRTTVYIYAPVGGGLGAATLDGDERPVAEYAHQGHPVAARTIDLEPGQERTMTYDLLGGHDQTDQVDLRVTPGVHGDGVGRVGPSACS